MKKKLIILSISSFIFFALLILIAIILKNNWIQTLNFFNINHLYYYENSNTDDKSTYVDSIDPNFNGECNNKIDTKDFYIVYYVKESDVEITNTGTLLHGDFDQLISNLKYVASFYHNTCQNITKFFIKDKRGGEVVSKSLYKSDDEFQIILNRANKKFKDYLNVANEDCGDCLLEISLFFDASIPYFTDPHRYSTGESLIEEKNRLDNNKIN